MSKISSCRGMLDNEPFNFDKLLTKYCNDEDFSIKSNVGRIQKNLSSDVAEAIEEGTVASLIQLSLEVNELINILFIYYLFIISLFFRGN